MFLQNTNEMNGGNGGSTTTTSRLPIVANGGETGGDTPPRPLSSQPVVPLQNGAHSSTSSLTPTVQQQHQSKSTLSDKTTLSRSTATNGAGGGVKNYTRSAMQQENSDSTINGPNVSVSSFYCFGDFPMRACLSFPAFQGSTTASEKFQALRNAYDSSNDSFRSRPIMKQADAR